MTFLAFRVVAKQYRQTIILITTIRISPGSRPDVRIEDGRIVKGSGADD